MEWKPIIGYEKLYKISNTGQVWSVKKQRSLKPFMTYDGYLKIKLSKNGRRRGFYCHRLVAMSFLNNFHEKCIVNHINGKRSDNMLSNLECVNIQENCTHRYFSRKDGSGAGVNGNRNRWTVSFSIDGWKIRRSGFTSRKQAMKGRIEMASLLGNKNKYVVEIMEGC